MDGPTATNIALFVIAFWTFGITWELMRIRKILEEFAGNKRVKLHKESREKHDDN